MSSAIMITELWQWIRPLLDGASLWDGCRRDMCERSSVLLHLLVLSPMQEDLSEQLHQLQGHDRGKQLAMKAPPVTDAVNSSAVVDCCPAVPQISISPFQWIIDNFSEHRRRARSGNASAFVNSAPFYSHDGGYKLCLTMFPDGLGAGQRRYLTVGCRLVAGEHDDALSWPMRDAITVSLIDRKFGVVRVSHQFQYDSVPLKSRYRLSRPRAGSMNDGIGATKFVNLNKLCNDSRLLADDAVVLRCVVTKSDK